MNNQSKSYDFSRFPFTANGFENYYLNDALQSRLLNGVDPLHIYADHEEQSDEDMAFLLRCDQAEYARHLDSMTSKVGLRLSPLQPENVLAFCDKVGVHPAFFSSRYHDPRMACQPHIFRAICAVAFGDYPECDRLQARQAIQNEESRYEFFIAHMYRAEEFFKGMHAFALERGYDILLNRNIKSEIQSLEQGELKTAMLKTFNHQGFMELTQPENHADELQDMKSEEFSNNKRHYDLMKNRSDKVKKDLEILIGMTFGSENIENVLKYSEGFMDLDPEIDMVTRQEIQPSLSEHMDDLFNQLRIKFGPKLKNDVVKNLTKKFVESNRPEDAIRMIAEGYFGYAEMVAHMRVHGAKLDEMKEYMDDLNRWQKITEKSNNSYYQYLYMNHVALLKKPLRLEYKNPSGPEIA